MRSGIRSWSKWVIFSRRMKSSSSVGPRSPALSECWLSATGTPWLVVSARAVESTRTRSSGPTSGLWPMFGEPLPVFSLPFASVTVLEPTIGSAGLTKAPAGGASAACGSYSLALFGLNGKAAARSPVAAAFSASVSPGVGASGWLGPATVGRLARTSLEGGCFCLAMRGLAEAFAMPRRSGHQASDRRHGWATRGPS